MLVGFAVVGLVICLLLWWILGKQYDVFREYLRDTRTFTSTAIEALRDIKHSCNHCHDEIIETVKTEIGKTADEILANMQAEHDATRDVVSAIGREEDRTVEAIKGVREAIERNNELLRLHINPPPVLGVGSQVRDSGGGTP